MERTQSLSIYRSATGSYQRRNYHRWSSEQFAGGLNETRCTCNLDHGPHRWFADCLCTTIFQQDFGPGDARQELDEELSRAQTRGKDRGRQAVDTRHRQHLSAGRKCRQRRHNSKLKVVDSMLSRPQGRIFSSRHSTTSANERAAFEENYAALSILCRLYTEQSALPDRDANALPNF